MNLFLVGSWKYEVVFILFLTLICAPLSDRPASEHLSKQMSGLLPREKISALYYQGSVSKYATQWPPHSLLLVWHGLNLFYYIAPTVDLQMQSGIYREVQPRSSWAGRDRTIPPQWSSQIPFHFPTSNSTLPQHDHEIETELRIKRCLWNTRPSTLIHCHQHIYNHIYNYKVLALHFLERCWPHKYPQNIIVD